MEVLNHISYGIYAITLPLLLICLIFPSHQSSYFHIYNRLGWAHSHYPSQTITWMAKHTLIRITNMNIYLLLSVPGHAPMALSYAQIYASIVYNLNSLRCPNNLILVYMPTWIWSTAEPQGPMIHARTIYCWWNYGEQKSCPDSDRKINGNRRLT